jgi:hypothetical protein
MEGEKTSNEESTDDPDGDIESDDFDEGATRSIHLQSP